MNLIDPHIRDHIRLLSVRLARCGPIAAVHYRALLDKVQQEACGGWARR